MKFCKLVNRGENMLTLTHRPFLWLRHIWMNRKSALLPLNHRTSSQFETPTYQKQVPFLWQMCHSEALLLSAGHAARVLVWVSATASLALQAPISLCTVHRTAWRSLCIQTQESYKEMQTMSIVCIFCDICMNLPNQPCPIPIHWIICSFSVLHCVYMCLLASLFLFFFFIPVLVLLHFFPTAMPRVPQHLVQGLMSKATLRERLKRDFPDYDGTWSFLWFWCTLYWVALTPWIHQHGFSLGFPRNPGSYTPQHPEKSPA